MQSRSAISCYDTSAARIHCTLRESCHQRFRKSHIHTALYPPSFKYNIHTYIRNRTREEDHHAHIQPDAHSSQIVALAPPTGPSRAILGTTQPTFLPTCSSHNHDHHTLDQARPSHGISNTLLQVLPRALACIARTHAYAKRAKRTSNEPEMKQCTTGPP